MAMLGVRVIGLWAGRVFAQEVPQRDVFFGETHVHTSWSFDAYIFGNHITGPADAYKYCWASPSIIRWAIRSHSRSTGWA
jgi:hypothetical protein